MDEALRLPDIVDEFFDAGTADVKGAREFRKGYYSFYLRSVPLSTYEKLVRFMIKKGVLVENHEKFGEFLGVVLNSALDFWQGFIERFPAVIKDFVKNPYLNDVRNLKEVREWISARIGKVRDVQSFMQLIEEADRRFGRVFGTVGILIGFCGQVRDDFEKWSTGMGLFKDELKSFFEYISEAREKLIYLYYMVLACYLKNFDLMRGRFLEKYLASKNALDTDTLNKEPTVFCYFSRFGGDSYIVLDHYVTDYHYWVDEPDMIMSYLGFEQETWSEEIMARMFRLRNVVNFRDNGGAEQPDIHLYIGNLYANPLARQFWFFKYPYQLFPPIVEKEWRHKVEKRGYLDYLGRQGFYYPLFVEMEVVKKLFRKKAPSPALGFFYWSYLRLPFDYYGGDYRTKKIHGWHFFYPYLLLNEIFSNTLKRRIKGICEEEGFLEKYERFLDRYVGSVDDYEAYRRVPRKFQNFFAAMVPVLLNFYLNKRKVLGSEEKEELKRKIDVLLRKTVCLTREGKAFVDALIFLLLRGGAELIESGKSLREVSIRDELLKDGDREFGKRFFNFRRGFNRAFNFVNEFPDVFYMLVRRSSSVGCFFAGAFLWHVLYEKGVEGLGTEGVRRVIEALIDNPRTPSMVWAWLLPHSSMGYSELGYAVRKFLDEYRTCILDSFGRSFVCRMRKLMIGFNEDFLEKDLQKEVYDFEFLIRESDVERMEALKKFEEGLRKWGVRFFKDAVFRYFADELFLKRAFDLIESGEIKISDEEKREFYKIMAVCCKTGDLQMELLKKGFDVRCCLARNPHLAPRVFTDLFLEEGKKSSEEYFWLLLNFYAFNPLSSPRMSALYSKVSDSLMDLAGFIDVMKKDMGGSNSVFKEGSGAFEFLRKIGEFLRTGKVSEKVIEKGDVDAGIKEAEIEAGEGSGESVRDFSVSFREVYDLAESRKLDDVRFDFSFLLKNRECLEALVRYCVINREESDMSNWNDEVRAFYRYVAAVLRKGLIDAYEKGDEETLRWLRGLARDFYTYQKNYAFFELTERLERYHFDDEYVDKFVGKGFKEEFRKEVEAMGDVFYETLRGFLAEDIGGGLDVSYGSDLKYGGRRVFFDVPSKENLYFEKKTNPNLFIKDCFFKFNILDPFRYAVRINEKKLFPFWRYDINDPFQRRLAIWELLLKFKHFNDKQLKGLDEWYKSQIEDLDGEVVFPEKEGEEIREVVISDDMKNKEITYEEVKEAVRKMIDYICGDRCDDEEKRKIFQLLDEIEAERRVRNLIDTIYGHWDIINDFLKMLKIAVENDYLLKDQVEADRILETLYRFSEKNFVIKEFFYKLIRISKDLKDYDMKGYRFAMFKASEAFRDEIFEEAGNNPRLALSFLVPDEIQRAFSNEGDVLRTGNFKSFNLKKEYKFYDYVRDVAEEEYMRVGSNFVQRSWIELSRPEVRALVDVMSYGLEEDYWGVERSLWYGRPLKDLVRIGREVYDGIEIGERDFFKNKKMELKQRLEESLSGFERYFEEGRVIPEDTVESAFLKVSGLANVQVRELLKEEDKKKLEEGQGERGQLEKEQLEKGQLEKEQLEKEQVGREKEEMEQGRFEQEKLEKVKFVRAKGKKDDKVFR